MGSIFRALKSNLLIWFLAIILISLFLFSRLYNITNTLEFFGDIGRDHLVLLQWWQTGKVPLLGPGLNYFSLHLPAIYYYLNYPIFLISRFSPYTTIITLLIFFILSFLCALIAFKKKEYIIALLVIALLVIFHPQYILQTRLPWNPTFAAPFLGIAIFSLLLLREKYSSNKYILFSISTATAVGLSVETIPTVLVMTVSALWTLPHRLKNIIYFSTSMICVFLPLIIFELRHQFFFIARLIADPITQPFKIDMTKKFSELLAFLFGINEWNSLSISIVASIFLVIFVYVIINWKQKKIINLDKFLFLLTLFSFSLILTYILPFPAKTHDIFGISILFFIAVAFLPLRFSLMVSGLLLILWLNPGNFNNYFKAGHRTVAGMEKCAVKICSFERNPMYISVTAWYVYHKTPEYQFLFMKEGCQVDDITLNLNWADKMLVIADNEPYKHGETAYNELTLFGKSTLEKEYTCQENLKGYLLKKINSQL